MGQGHEIHELQTRLVGHVLYLLHDSDLYLRLVSGQTSHGKGEDDFNGFYLQKYLARGWISFQ